MDLLHDWWIYNSCYEIPRSYAFWSAFGLLGGLLHRKVCFLHGDIEIHAMIYTGLIGPPNQKKSTVVNFARQMYTKVAPELALGPSRTSPEKICELMAQKDFAKGLVNYLGENDPQGVRPMTFFINEFKNFLGRGPYDMINFITDIYDVKRYPAATLARGLEDVLNPAISIVMCETPSWFVKNMRTDLVTGGIARRFILCYETDPPEPKPNIVITPEARAAWKRCEDRLVEVRKLHGLFTWGPGANEQYVAWYNDNARRAAEEQNEPMRGYLGSKNTQLYKVMMLLDIASERPNFLFTKEWLELGLAHLDGLERNMPKLYAAAGRNEMLGPQQKMVEALIKADGWMPEKFLMRVAEQDLQPMEVFSVMKHLEASGQIIRREWDVPLPNGKFARKLMCMTPEKYEELTKNGSLIEKVEPLKAPHP